MNHPHVTVIVPFWRDPRLRLCIQALSDQTLDPSRFEVILVNNDPADSTDYGPLSANMRIITETKPGSYAARNSGIRAGNGHIIAYTDADCIPSPDWLERGLQSISELEHQLISGRIEVFREVGGSRAAWIYEVATAFDQKRSAALNRAATANLFVRREVFDTAGLFNEGAFSGGDWEWTERSAKFGFELRYCPWVVVQHPARSSFWQLRLKQRRKFHARIGRQGRGTLGVISVGLAYCLPSLSVIRQQLCVNERLARKVFVIWYNWLLRISTLPSMAVLLTGRQERR